MITRYFKWLCEQIGYRDLPYHKLLWQMLHTPFYWKKSIVTDANRAGDGEYLRVLYSEQTGFNVTGIGSCSVLEMLVALALRIEDVMGDPGENNQGKWFSDMLYNLSLASMNDHNMLYSDKTINDILVKWMKRKPNDLGETYELFPVSDDMRSMPIWEKVCSYLNKSI